MIKYLPAMWKTQLRRLGRKDPLEKEMATHSSILAWRIPWTEEPGRLQSIGMQRVRHDWAPNTFTFRCIWQENYRSDVLFLTHHIRRCIMSIHFKIFSFKNYVFIFYSTGSSLFCSGFSLPWSPLLQSTGSRTQASIVAAHRPLSMGSVVVEHGVYLPSSMWNLPGLGIKSMSLALTGGFLTSGPPGKSLR